MSNPFDFTPAAIKRILSTDEKYGFLMVFDAYIKVNTILLNSEVLSLLKKGMEKTASLEKKKGKSNERIIELQFKYLIKEICYRLRLFTLSDSEAKNVSCPPPMSKVKFFISNRNQVEMTKELTCQYLSMCLANDNSLRATIKDFYKRIHPVEDKSYEVDDNDIDYLNKHRAYYFENAEIQDLYKSIMFPNNSSKSYYDLGDGKNNILELYLFEAMEQVKAYSMFFDLFFKNVVPHEVQSNKETKSAKTVGLKKAYYSFEKTINQLKNDGLLNEFKLANQLDYESTYSSMNFVCSWFVFRSLELTYRFRMVAMLAHQMRKNPKLMYSHSFELIEIMCSQMPLPFFYDYNLNVDLSPFMLSDKKIAEYCGMDGNHEQQTEVFLMRIVANIALTIYINTYSPRLQPAWSESDFDRVAFYLKGDCDIYKHLSSMKLPEEQDEEYWKCLLKLRKKLSSNDALSEYRRIQKSLLK